VFECLCHFSTCDAEGSVVIDASVYVACACVWVGVLGKLIDKFIRVVSRAYIELT
jgi:hypothetical protein